MRLQIQHKTSYTFSDAVFLEPHTLRFHPQARPWLSTESFSLAVTPSPAGERNLLNEDNGIVRLCWFSGQHVALTIVSEAVVNLNPFDPFAFLVQPASCGTVPFDYPDSQGELLAPALKCGPLPAELLQYSTDCLAGAGNDTVALLSQLTLNISRDFSLVVREEGDPLAPGQTFSAKEGSCRDLAWMQIQLLRHMGIAARFVSGYLFIEGEDPEWELHAWVEAFVPGAGWIGLDPSHGLAAAQFHVPVAASAFPANTMPVTGNLRGSASSELTTDLRLQIH